MAHSYLIEHRIKVRRAAEETGLHYQTGILISHGVVDMRGAHRIFSSSLHVTAEEQTLCVRLLFARGGTSGFVALLSRIDPVSSPRPRQRPLNKAFR